MYAIVDIETTGGRAPDDAVIEVAVVLTDGVRIVDQYHSLVQPDVKIPIYISSLTGIRNEMLYDAPTFDQIVKDLHSFLDGHIFVAHNVGFDYNFLKEAFSRHHYTFHPKRLCTVRLSRKIFPGLPSYSLGNLCRSLDIAIRDRHRAMGDAQATTILFHKMMASDKEGWIEKSLKSNSREAIIPPNLDKAIFEELPRQEGIYYFLNEKNEVIYVGKAKDIKKRITSHFTHDLNRKNQIGFRNQIYNISYELTGNEFIAYLLESYEIKRLRPQFNFAQRRIYATFGIFQYIDRNGYLRFAIDKAAPGRHPLASFPTLPDARNYLSKLAAKFDLCLKMCSLEKAKASCREHKFGVCNGACGGIESPEHYNNRAELALEQIFGSDGNMLIIGKGRERNEKSVVCLENGKFLGFGFLNGEDTLSNVEDAKEIIKAYPDNADIQRIVRSYIRGNIRDKIIRY